jgi:ABC-type polysaccharide/polyol phosphate transport system ATPase subunit
MGDLALRVENLSKLYRLGRAQKRHDTLRDALVHQLQSPARWLRRKGAPNRGTDDDTLWALKDVSFEVARGEVIGVIGRNGAGKSTLLKILSRITEPTDGCAHIHGRIGSLLEVGTGFHPELTGRENIYLNGAILGMKRTEITRKFDAIVAFAEVAKFLDTPVKHYSSGMYVRLAFAVAAHLEPEILLVDEVLAVGDAQFQKKCLGKMGDVAQEGRTVLFVSHNMNAVRRLCARSLMIEGGRLAADGPTRTVVPLYLARGAQAVLPSEWIDLAHARRSGTQEVSFMRMSYTSGNEAAGFQPYANGPLEITLDIASQTAKTVGSLAVTLYDHGGAKLVNADTVSLGHSLQLAPGHNVVRLRIDSLHLNAGAYVLGLWLADAAGSVYDHIESAAKIDVVGLEPEGFGVRPSADGLVPCQFDVLVAD